MFGLFLVLQLLKTVGLYLSPHRKRLLRKHFDLLRKPDSNVPMYADESGLLVFASPLTSASLSKNRFFDRLRRLRNEDACLIVFFYFSFAMPTTTDAMIAAIPEKASVEYRPLFSW